MKTKTHLNILLTTLVIFAVIPACIFTTSPAPSTQPDENSTSVVPDGDPQAPVDFGTIGFTLDTARQTSGTFDFMSGEGLTLTAADANGYGWMLSIPADALLSNTEIKMTPFATLDVTQSEAKIISGVQLEPDGLQFTDAVRLSVTAPDDNPGIGLIFSFQQDGTGMAFAPTDNTTGGKMAVATIWHFSSAGYTNGETAGDDGLNAYRQMAEEGYRWALAAARLFIQNGAPTPPTPPSISQFCRGTEVKPEQGESYEYIQEFLSPYEDHMVVLLGSMKSLALFDPSRDFTDGFEMAQAIMQMAENSILQVGDQVQAENPPDRLPAVISTALRIGRELALAGGPSAINPKVTLWAEYLRDYYFGELKTKHDYRAFPILLSLNRQAQLIGGEDRLTDIMAAMTFEVILDTRFDASLQMGEGGSRSTGHEEHHADVTDITNLLNPPDFLWGKVDNLIFTTTTGTFTEPSGTYTLDGQTLTNSLWLKNWDACVTKTFDVVVSNFLGVPEDKSIAEGAALVSFEQYWWNGTGFMFTVPMQNLNQTLGDQSFSGSGTRVEGDYTSSAQIHIVIKHTP